MRKPLYTRYQLVKRRRKVSPAAVLWLSGGVVLGVLAFWLWRVGVEPADVKPVPLNNSLKALTNLQKKAAAPARGPAGSATTGSRTVPLPPPLPAPLLANVPPGAVRPPIAQPVPAAASEILETQVALDRAGFSVGSIDGVLGSQTRAALKVFQQERGILATGQLDTATRQALALREPALGSYVITAEDLSRLRPTGKTWLGKSQQDYLGYENLLELVAEKSHAHPVLIQKLNPTTDWNALLAGEGVVVPNATLPAPRAKAARVRISLSSKTLQVFDAGDKLLAHFPVSIGRIAEKRPVGDLHVANAAPNPNYTFDPAVFPESAEAQKLGRKLVLPPGPNNPVGVAWIGLDRPGFGIHGTPSPEAVGRTESHGCFRLANWNAEYLVKVVWAGLPVVVEP